jgi:multiple sugar transport system permease protein
LTTEPLAKADSRWLASRVAVTPRLPAGLALSAAATILATLWVYPLFGAFVATIHAPGEALPLSLAAYGEALSTSGLGQWLANSLLTATGVTLGVLAIGATCGYAISQLRFPGRRLVWFLVLASFFVPVQALIISHFLLMYQMKLLNSWLGVILPQLIAPMAVIVYKQFFDAVPRQLREAAVLDSATEWRMLFRIYLPLSSGVTAGLGIVTFVTAWNTFLWPFLAVTREEMMNVAVAIDQIRGNGLAAALLATLPVLLVYLRYNRRILQAVTLTGGVKG